MEPLLTLMRHLGQFAAVATLGEPRSGDTSIKADGAIIVCHWQTLGHDFTLATSFVPRTTRVLTWHDSVLVPTCTDDLTLHELRLVDGVYSKLIITDDDGIQHRLTHDKVKDSAWYAQVPDRRRYPTIMSHELLEKLLPYLPYEVLPSAVRPSLTGVA